MRRVLVSEEPRRRIPQRLISSLFDRRRLAFVLAIENHRSLSGRHLDVCRLPDGRAAIERVRRGDSMRFNQGAMPGPMPDNFARPSPVIRGDDCAPITHARCPPSFALLPVDWVKLRRINQTRPPRKWSHNFFIAPAPINHASRAIFTAAARIDTYPAAGPGRAFQRLVFN